MVSKESPDASMCKAGTDISAHIDALTIISNLELVGVLTRFFGGKEPSHSPPIEQGNETPAEVAAATITEESLPMEDGPGVDKLKLTLSSGALTIDYRGLLNGLDYVPQPSGRYEGFGALIRMNSYLVYYR